MTRMYLKETYYCSLHLRKNSCAINNADVKMNVIRNSDSSFLDIDNSSWSTSPVDITLTETVEGIYQYPLDISVYNNLPDSYTIVYKYTNQEVTLVNSEQILFENKNKSRLV